LLNLIAIFLLVVVYTFSLCAQKKPSGSFWEIKNMFAGSRPVARDNLIFQLEHSYREGSWWDLYRIECNRGYFATSSLASYI
jgi:hypothetical protein